MDLMKNSGMVLKKISFTAKKPLPLQQIQNQPLPKTQKFTKFEIGQDKKLSINLMKVAKENKNTAEEYLFNVEESQPTLRKTLHDSKPFSLS